MARAHHRAAALTASALVLCVVAAACSDTKSLGFASAGLKLADGTSIGTVHFAAQGTDRTKVTVELSVPAGRTPVKAFHGFHIHANSDPANGEGCIADAKEASSTWFVAVDGHWKADGQDHGAHNGDMPAVYVDGAGRATASFLTDHMTAADVKGKAVVFHAGADNYGNVPVGSAPDQYAANSDTARTKTAGTGNAGDRIACGVITLT